MRSWSGNSSQTREECCGNFLVLSRIRLGEHSLISLTLSWSNFKNNKLDPFPKYWLLAFLFCFVLVMSLGYLDISNVCRNTHSTLYTIKGFTVPQGPQGAPWWCFKENDKFPKSHYSVRDLSSSLSHRSDGGISSLYILPGITVNAFDMITKIYLWTIWQRYWVPSGL